MATIDEVIQAAMTLGEDERFQVAELLWDSLAASTLDLAAREEIQQELQSAWDEYQSGRDPGRSWQEVRGEMVRESDDAFRQQLNQRSADNRAGLEPARP